MKVEKFYDKRGYRMAELSENDDKSCTLMVWSGNDCFSKLVLNRTYKNRRGAMIALSKFIER